MSPHVTTIEPDLGEESLFSDVAVTTIVELPLPDDCDKLIQSGIPVILQSLLHVIEKVELLPER